MRRSRAVGMQRIAMRAERADCESGIIQLGSEVLKLLRVIEHGELTVMIAGIVAGAQFQSLDSNRAELFEGIFQR